MLFILLEAKEASMKPFVLLEVEEATIKLK